jgi:formate-dependent nitrite reductase membrane component NrfD
LLLPHLIVAALAAGGAALTVIGYFGRVDVELLWATAMLMSFSLVVHGLVILAELFGSHPNADAARAARLMTEGDWRWRFWGGVAIAGIVVPVALVWLAPWGAVAGAILALGGLWIYEDLWIKAGQSIPLS